MPRVKEFINRISTFIKSHKKILLIFIPIIIIAVIVFVLFPKKKTPITTHTAQRGELIQTISANGTLESENSVKLSFLIGGKLVYLAGKPGDSVKANSVLANLDQRTVQKNIQNALYDYSKQRNTFDQTLKNNNATQISDAVNDTIRRTLENSQYDLNKAVVSVDLQNLAEEQSVLITPVGGIITREDVNTTGVNVSPTTVFEVTDPNSLNFKMEVDQADIGKLEEGQSVKVILDSFPDEELTMTVTKIDFASHTTSTGGDAYYVKGKLTSDNSDYKFRVGMNGSAEVTLDKKENVILIPLSSVFDDDKVYVKNGNKYEKKTVKLGVQNDTDTEVISGIEEGDEIVIDPSLVK